MTANSILFQSNQRFASLMVLSIGGGPALMERSTIKQQWIQMHLFQLSAIIIQHPDWLDRQGECSEIRLKIRNCSSRCNLWSIGPAHLLSKLQQPLLYIQSSDLSTPRFNPVWPRDPLLCLVDVAAAVGVTHSLEGGIAWCRCDPGGCRRPFCRLHPTPDPDPQPMVWYGMVWPTAPPRLWRAPPTSRARHASLQGWGQPTVRKKPVNMKRQSLTNSVPCICEFKSANY